MSGEEKSLDDFFAKKDKGRKGKSRGKGKGKFTTSSSSTIREQVESSKKNVNEQSKEQKQSWGLAINSQNEDEWLDFNEPKEKDYTGLKVQSFQTMERAEGELDEETKIDDECDDGDSTDKKEKSSSVWQPVGLHQPAPQVPIEEPVPKEEAKKDSVYVPPGRRNMATSQANDQSWKYGSGTSVRRDRRPPEINSEIAFPSLATTADVSTKSEAKSAIKFETVRHGARSSNEQAVNRRTNIDIGNKFDALSNSK